MSDQLGTINYPQAEEEPQAANPLAKYHQQLDPLAKMTDQLWRPVRQAQTAPINPYMGQMLTDMGARGMTPAVGTPPQGPLPPPEAAPPSAQLAAAAPQAAPGATPAGTLAEQGGPTDVTQYQQDPDTGAITRGPAGAPAGSEQLAAAGGAPGEGAPSDEPSQAPEGAPETPFTPGDEHRVSPSLQSEKGGRTPHASNDRQIHYGLVNEAKAAKKGDRDYADKVADLIKEQHGKHIDFTGADTPQKVHERFIQHLTGNILHVYDSVPKGTKGWLKRATRWYEGANKIAHQWAAEHGYSPRQIAGLLAALSPRMDWFQNVELGRRVLDTVRNKQGVMTSDAMMAKGRGLQESLKADWNKKRIGAALDAMQGKTFGQLTDNYHRALWQFLHDATENKDRSYRVVTPEGDFGQVQRNKPKKEGQPGEPTTASYMSVDPIEKAMAILHGGDDRENISRNLSDAHKVRSFYNNIIAPWSRHGDVTIDTHAIAAALLRPLGQSDTDVMHGLGSEGPQSDTHGISGLYPLYAEAYRRAAQARNVLPRQMQSASWEGMRGIFDPAQKRNEKIQDAVENIWQQHGKGLISSNTARTRIYGIAGLKRQPRAPAWHGAG